MTPLIERPGFHRFWPLVTLILLSLLPLYTTTIGGGQPNKGLFTEQGLWALLYIMWPYILFILLAALYVNGKLRSMAAVGSGILSSVIILPFYIEFLTYDGTSGQIGLLLMVAPIYQILIFFVSWLLCRLALWIKRKWGQPETQEK